MGKMRERNKKKIKNKKFRNVHQRSFASKFDEAWKFMIFHKYFFYFQNFLKIKFSWILGN